MSIRILSAGMFTTVQDLGRYGYQQFGVPVAGAVDADALRLANLLVGNDENAAALECTMLGPEIEFTEETVFAVVGGDFPLSVNGIPVSDRRAIRVRAHDVLSVAPARSGCRCYIAFGGGIDVPAVMNSRSTYVKASIGGYHGRALQSGDELPLFPAEIPDNLPARFLPPAPTGESPCVLRVILGPQQDRFTESGIHTFFQSTYTVGTDSDRMGCRLEGAKIEHTADANILSDGIAFGAIQVPGSGQPIIMLSDRQTTGGYTKIGTVISADLGKLAQCRPGDSIRFREIGVEDAQTLYLENQAELRRIRERLNRPTGITRDFSIQTNGNSYLVSVTPILM